MFDLTSYGVEDKKTTKSVIYYITNKISGLKVKNSFKKKIKCSGIFHFAHKDVKKSHQARKCLFNKNVAR